jgi:two-component sensor histidine kinase
MMTSMRQGGVEVARDGVWLVLAELNHRVLNELQAALSALRLPQRGVGSGESGRFIEEAAVRLQCFGEVHQLLDRQRHQGPLAQRLEALCRAISLAKAAPLGIGLALALNDVSAEEETAWTVCVVAFELMTNAFKHAFVGGLPGVVGVVLRQEGGDVLLTVTDNGVGCGVEERSVESIWRTPGFGSGIVTQLAERLGGCVTCVRRRVGTTTTLIVPAAAQRTQ